MIFSISWHSNYPFSVYGPIVLRFGDLVVSCGKSKPLLGSDRHHLRKKVVDFLFELDPKGNFIGNNWKVKDQLRQLNTSILNYLPSARTVLAHILPCVNRVAYLTKNQSIINLILSKIHLAVGHWVGRAPRFNLSISGFFRDSRRNKLLFYAPFGGAINYFFGSTSGKHALDKSMDFFLRRAFSPVLISRVPEFRGENTDSNDEILVKSNFSTLILSDSAAGFGLHETINVKGKARA